MNTDYFEEFSTSLTSEIWATRQIRVPYKLHLNRSQT
jgi:hypothetical protein